MTRTTKEEIKSEEERQQSDVETTKTTDEEKRPQSEVITLTREQLKGLIQEEVQKGLRGGFKPPKKVTERVASLRFYKGKPVVWYGDVKEVLETSTGKRIGFMNIKMLDDEKPVNVNYLDFLNSNLEGQETYQVQIKEQKAREVVESSGRRMAENPNPAHDPTTGKPLASGIWKPQEVEMEVTTYKYTAVVEVLEGPLKGKTFTVPSDCLNQ